MIGRLALAAVSYGLAGRQGKGGLRWSLHRRIALPAFIFKCQALNGHGVAVSIELRHCPELRRPAAIDVVGYDPLAGLVVDLQNDVLAEVLRRNIQSVPAC
jgi:hypothetical protein